MIFALRYFCVISLYGFVLIIFSAYIYCHFYLQYISQIICKEYEEPSKIYDYVVVGSGTAGSIIAHRLAQDGKNKILLLEAGPHSSFLYGIPSLTPLLQQTMLDWKYETVPQKHACWGLNNNVSLWPMGKIFGGTHRFNYMIYVRGHEQDYSEWYKDKEDYNYETDILYYFKKLENWATGNEDEGTQHSPGKVMYIDNNGFTTALADAIIKGAKILQNSSEDGRQNISGFTKPHVTTRNKKRWTTSDSLLEKNYNNIRILTNAQVTKVMFKNNFEAYAIQYTYLGDKKIVRARKGIILSAGAIGTPKILLLSGVGPKKHLASLKIRPRINLPVGENLQDHITTGLDLITLNQSLSFGIESLLSPVAAFNYFLRGKGLWTSNGCEVIGFSHRSTGNARKSDNLPDQRQDWSDQNQGILGPQPDLQYMFLPSGVSADGGKHFRKAFAIGQKLFDAYFANLVSKQVITFLPVLLHPKGRGTIRLKNSNPTSPPFIDPNYLSHPDDVDLIIQGIQVIKNLISTQPLQEFGAELNRFHFPGCENFHFDTRDYWECYVRHLTISSFHPVGTCKMSHSKDPSAVVDYDFRVVGTNKLFVADGSVMPTLVSGNTNAAIALIAEKAADSVKYFQYLNSGVSMKTEIFLRKNIC